MPQKKSSVDLGTLQQQLNEIQSKIEIKKQQTNITENPHNENSTKSKYTTENEKSSTEQNVGKPIKL